MGSSCYECGQCDTPQHRGLQSSQQVGGVVALAGIPNTGKSTLFNRLTGLRQHTGNWAGKTVACAEGTCNYKGRKILLLDLPGTYSLSAQTAEEALARDFLVHNTPAVTVVVADATCLERSLSLALQVLALTPRVVVALNLVEEAARKGIHVNTTTLSTQLGVPVVAINARTGKGLEQLMGAVDELAGHPSTSHAATEPTQGKDIDESFLERCHRNADAVAERVVVRRPPVAPDWGSRLDEIATSRRWGFPLMLLLLAGVIWLTIVGANIPSRMLAGMFFWGESQLTALCGWVGVPDWLHGFLVLGVYRGLGWVISVMLPPMAIFFPLFMLLEDFGYLPRVAFNLDRIFKKAGTHGKQSLTMSMGFGCNAAGVIACRILDSPRDRMIATVTNNFIPCNGRFPTLIVLATIFIGSAVSPSSSTLVAALAIVGTVLLGVGVTFAVSWTLSRTLLRGVPSIFTLELPPYRIPLVGQVLLRSLVDRTWFVLKRAIAVAAPAGGITWLLGNVTLGDNTLLASVSSGLDPMGRALGLDGFILLAFLLSLPANEILLPVLLMSYASAGSLVEVGGVEGIRQVLVVEQGWTWVTGLSVMLFSLLHYPCGTTLWTIYRETRSAAWTVFSALMPLGVALTLCLALAQTARLLGQG